MGPTECSRVNLGTAAPAARAALADLNACTSAYAASVGIEQSMLDLVKIRSSQLNGCAYCLQRHTQEALSAGESSLRLAVLPAWQESSCFTERERAALRYTEAITIISTGHVPDAVYEACSEALDEREMAAIAWATITINAYNRVATVSRYLVGP